MKRILTIPFGFLIILLVSTESYGFSTPSWLKENDGSWDPNQKNTVKTSPKALANF